MGELRAGCTVLSCAWKLRLELRSEDSQEDTVEGGAFTFRLPPVSFPFGEVPAHFFEFKKMNVLST